MPHKRGIAGLNLRSDMSHPTLAMAFDADAAAPHALQLFDDDDESLPVNSVERGQPDSAVRLRGARAGRQVPGERLRIARHDGERQRVDAGLVQALREPHRSGGDRLDVARRSTQYSILSETSPGHFRFGTGRGFSPRSSSAEISPFPSRSMLFSDLAAFAISSLESLPSPS